MKNKIKKQECGIVNMDSDIGSGTHWVAYIKYLTIAYVDSNGNLPSPIEAKLLPFQKQLISLKPHWFATKAPIIHIDCPRQREVIQSGSIPLSVKFEMQDAAISETSA